MTVGDGDADGGIMRFLTIMTIQCPLCRLMYAARDISATVGSLGLITSSIVSKKVAGRRGEAMMTRMIMILMTMTMLMKMQCNAMVMMTIVMMTMVMMTMTMKMMVMMTMVMMTQFVHKPG